MLILTRRIGEALIINDNIKVIILAAIGNQIRVGIDAPPEVKVHREEVYQRIHAQTLGGDIALEEDAENYNRA